MGFFVSSRKTCPHRLNSNLRVGMAAAGVFTIFCTLLDVMPSEAYWPGFREVYEDLCLFWFCLGLFIFAIGFLHASLCGCDRNVGGGLCNDPAHAREIETDVEGAASAPTPYVMITG